MSPSADLRARMTDLAKRPRLKWRGTKAASEAARRAVNARWAKWRKEKR